MGRRATKKPEAETADSEGFDDWTGVEGDGSGPEPQEAHDTPDEHADEPDISWGPGKNFYGWAMTLLLAGLLTGVGVAGFKLFGETVGNPNPSAAGEGRKELEKKVQTLGADLCAASMGAGATPETSVQIFHQKVHQPLHVLAGALAEEDRPAAAKLLRHKFNVEEDIRRKVSPPELAVTLGALNESTMDGLRILSLPSPACPPPAAPPAPAPGP